MYGHFVLFDDTGEFERGERVYLADTNGKNESCSETLGLTIQKIIPVIDIDPAFARAG